MNADCFCCLFSNPLAHLATLCRNDVTKGAARNAAWAWGRNARNVVVEALVVVVEKVVAMEEDDEEEEGSDT